MTVTLDPAAVARARSLGGVGVAWLQLLPGVVDRLADDWGLTMGRSLLGGTASWAGLVRCGDGSPAVLKVALPHGDLGREVAAMLRADGQGYARVLRHDPDRHAVLLEALGPIPDPAVDGHVALMRRGARVLRVAWSVDRDPDEREAPDEDPKVSVLRALIDDELARIPEPVPVDVVDRARCLLDRRAEAWDPRRAVVVHGDAHIGNMLPVLWSRPGAVEGRVLIDPEAFLGDPAYDLGVLVREWTGVLSTSEDPRAEVRDWCRMLADETGVEEQAVWEWGYVERVTSGLHLMGIGLADRGRPLLDVAARLG
ncbi:MAG: aminoglycoside phosphotransferase family protein [Lapillicoccus sp.]